VLDFVNNFFNFLFPLDFDCEKLLKHSSLMTQSANFQPAQAYFGAEIFANPAGSRNLEFDLNK
jgi:hypothetical protein